MCRRSYREEQIAIKKKNCELFISVYSAGEKIIILPFRICALITFYDHCECSKFESINRPVRGASGATCHEAPK